MSMVEKVARAMLARSRPSLNPDEMIPAPRGLMGYMPRWTMYSDLAEAAIAALRTPTPAMLAAAVERSDRLADEVDTLTTEEDGYRAIFEAMIDAGMGDGK